MKEATGELNMTVITVVAIAAVAAFFYAFVWPNIQNSIKANTYCATAQCTDCQTGKGNSTSCKCYYGDNFDQGPITCTFRDGSNTNTNTSTSGTSTGTK